MEKGKKKMKEIPIFADEREIGSCTEIKRLDGSYLIEGFRQSDLDISAIQFLDILESMTEIVAKEIDDLSEKLSPILFLEKKSYYQGKLHAINALKNGLRGR